MFIPNVRAKITAGEDVYPAKIVKADGTVADITLYIRGLTADERDIILAGCLMNYYKESAQKAE